MRRHDNTDLKSPYYALGFASSALRTVLDSLEQDSDRYLPVRQLNLRTLRNAIEVVDLHFESLGEEAPKEIEEPFDHHDLEPRSCDNGDGRGHSVREWR